VLAAAEEAGFTAVSHLEGGVLAWVREVEPEKPTY
jgi:adenylyltransferase/sulfurtransferase